MENNSLEFWFKNLWRWKVGLNEEPIQTRLPNIKQLRGSEWSPRFERYMRNRLIMGAFRYGILNDSHKAPWDRLASIMRRTEKYEKTGNDELLVDIANLSLLEFVEGTHPKKHFSSSDDGEHVKEKCI